MAQKKYWKDSNEYKRIIEILDDYWLTEKDEKFVRVEMYFQHSNGEQQSKCITWHNPQKRKCILGDDRQYNLGLDNLKSQLISVKQFADMGDLPFKEYVMLKYGCDGLSCKECGDAVVEEPWVDVAYNPVSAKRDFAMDLARDDMFPVYNYSDLYTDKKHKKLLEEYLKSRGACKECLDVFSDLYEEWEDRYYDTGLFETLEDTDEDE